MITRVGEQWYCINPACRCEILIQSGSQVEGSNPRCTCGAPMKKKYTAPKFTYLDFLKLDELVAVRHGIREP